MARQMEEFTGVMDIGLVLIGVGHHGQLEFWCLERYSEVSIIRG